MVAEILLACDQTKLDWQYANVNKHVEFLTTQIVGTVKSAYSKDYAQI